MIRFTNSSILLLIIFSINLNAATCTLLQNAAKEYLVATYSELKLVGVSCALTASYRLTGDINASASQAENPVDPLVSPIVYQGFNPIGTSLTPFSGVFHGSLHTISGLYINLPAKMDIGLFGNTSNGSILDSVNLTGANITGKSAVGSLVGNSSSQIKNAMVTGTVRGFSVVGGLVGYNVAGILDSCTSRATVYGTNSVIGGLVGLNEGMIQNSHNTGLVMGDPMSDDIGGLVGKNSYIINRSYNTGAVTSNGDNLGGLAGENGGEISISYSSGPVQKIGNGKNNAGGLIGTNNSGTLITISNKGVYSTGSVNSGGWSAGGLFGNGGPNGNGDYITNFSTGDVYCPNCGYVFTLMNISVMTKPESFPKMDFTDTFEIVAGKSYPFLRNMDNAPFAFPDTLEGVKTFKLSRLLSKAFHDPELNGALVAKVIKLDLGTTDSIQNINLVTPIGDTTSVRFRVGQLLSAGDTLWGNEATTKIVKAAPYPLVISADDIHITQGGALSYAYTYTGFMNGDRASDVTGLTASCGGCINIGNYAIIPSGASADNYEISFKNGSLTIDAPTSIESHLNAVSSPIQNVHFDLLGRKL